MSLSATAAMTWSSSSSQGAWALLLMLVVASSSAKLAATATIFSPKVCTSSPTWATLGPAVQRNVTASLLTTTVSASYQNSLVNLTACNIIVYDQSFLKIVDTKAPIETLASATYPFAHEGTVYVPSLDAVFFTSNRLGNTSSPDQYVELSLLNLATNSVTKLQTTPPVVMANGAILDPSDDSSVLVLSQGSATAAGGIMRLNLRSMTVQRVLDNWQGLQFNSPNDIVVHPKTGIMYFTDPSYGFEQGFRPPPQLGEYVWAFDPKTGMASVVADGFVKPNGLVLSRDGRLLYISDTGFYMGTGAWNPARPHTVYVADVSKDGRSVGPRRLFAASSTGIPDGLKLDRMGNLYTASGDGVHVYSPSGKLLGSIMVGGVANFAIAKGRIVMMQETEVTAVALL